MQVRLNKLLALKLDSRQTLVCLHESKRFRCRHGTTLSIEEIKLSRKPAPGEKCRHHAMNEYNSTGSADHGCNVTKVTKNVRSRCQGRRECWFNLNKRLLGKDCVREVKYIMVNLTCDRSEYFCNIFLVVKLQTKPTCHNRSLCYTYFNIYRGIRKGRRSNLRGMEWWYDRHLH